MSVDKVKVDDLWSLFRPGDLIHMPTGETGGRYHEVWRIYRTRAPGPETSTSSSNWEFLADDHLEPDDDSKFVISAYHIDHDGTKFGTVRRKFDIESFVGMREIISLPVFPIQYCEGYQQLLVSLKDQSQKFINYMDDRHKQYSAWPQTINPPDDSDTDDTDDTVDTDEEILKDRWSNSMRYPEFLEGDVIVDLTEAYQNMPSWRPSFDQLPSNKSIRCQVKDDEILIQHWFGGSRQSLVYTQNEIIQNADGVEARQHRENLAIGTLLECRVKWSRTFEINPQALSLRDEDLVLLPKRMLAYALRERRFLADDLNLLKFVRRQAGVFATLRI